MRTPTMGKSVANNSNLPGTLQVVDSRCAARKNVTGSIQLPIPMSLRVHKNMFSMLGIPSAKTVLLDYCRIDHRSHLQNQCPQFQAQRGTCASGIGGRAHADRIQEPSAI